MEKQTSRRLDLSWTGANLGAAAALCLLAAAGLAFSARWRTFALGDSPPVDPARVASGRELVNPNTASFASLRRLPQLGPARAQAIIEYRRSGGQSPFRGPQDLMRVRGIGPGTAETVAGCLEFDPNAP